MLRLHTIFSIIFVDFFISFNDGVFCRCNGKKFFKHRNRKKGQVYVVAVFKWTLYMDCFVPQRKLAPLIAQTQQHSHTRHEHNLLHSFYCSCNCTQSQFISQLDNKKNTVDEGDRRSKNTTGYSYCILVHLI
jgi:hypothetical protein